MSPRAARREPARGPRAATYLPGGVVVLALSAAERLPLERVPLALAAVLLLAAASCGRDDGHWGAAIVLAGVGIGVLGAEEGWTGLDVTRTAGAAFGGALGLLLVVLLDARIAVGVPGTALATAATIAVLARREELPALGRPAVWGTLLLVLGAVNLLLWARDRELGAGAPRR
jgi:hypothetical protein